MLVAGLIGLANGAQQVFYLEVIEAVRPRGTAASALGWMWTVEGTAAAVGAWIGGSLSQNFSPRLCFLCTTTSVILGAIIVFAGKKHLLAADHLNGRQD
jgi:predicted MFS family arabinose efflux permease